MKSILKSILLLTVAGTMVGCADNYYENYAKKYPSHVVETEHGMTKAQVIKLWGREPNDSAIRKKGDVFVYNYGTGYGIGSIFICFDRKTNKVKETNTDKYKRIAGDDGFFCD